MKVKNKLLLLAAPTVFAAGVLAMSGSASAAIDGGYIGTAACLGCHTTSGYPGAADKTSFLEAGHRFKLRMTNGADCAAGNCDPLSNALPTPLISGINDAPGGHDFIALAAANSVDGVSLDWAAIDFVIGGWGWKARYGTKDPSGAEDVTGYIWPGTTIQYNALVGTWGAQYSGSDKKYNCSRCHNTNGTQNTGGTTRALPSPLGAFGSQHTYDGVQCEACHANAVRVENGPNTSNGAAHAADPTNVDMMGIAGGADVTLNVCGRCHNRNANDEGNPTAGAPAAGGYIKHHEQYNELMGTGNGAHKNLQCTDCHDPHVRTHKVPGFVATALGIGDNDVDAVTRGAVVACMSCHDGSTAAPTIVEAANRRKVPGHATPTCVDCHMGEATKSATAVTGTGGGKKADVKTHIFRIDPAADSADTASVNPAREALTLEYVCLKCHDSSMPDYQAGTPVLSKEVAAGFATDYHLMAGAIDVTGVDGGYVGSETCATCHTTHYSDFKEAGHSYKLRMTNGADCGAGACDALSNVLPTPLIAGINDAPGGHDFIALAAANSTDGVSLDWAAIDYVIGGWGWKARYGTKDPSGAEDVTGYIWPGTTIQYNALVGTWGAQYSGSDKKYNCSRCHNTNGTQNIGGTTRALPSPLGAFGSQHTFDGVQCEACHAAAVRVEDGANSSNAAAHISTGATMGVAGDGTKETLCGRCHNRNAGDEPSTAGAPTNGGYIKHHESYNELVGTDDEPGVHKNLQCIDCHNPHKRAHKVPEATAIALGIDDNDLSAEARGAVVSCQTSGCHDDVKTDTGLVAVMMNAGATCVDCHMAAATKSATAVKGDWGKQGDVKSHIFKINPAYDAEDTAAANPAHNYLSLEYVCGKCHDNSIGSASYLTKAEAAAFAPNMHGVVSSSKDASIPHNVYARFNWYQGDDCYLINVDGSVNGESCSWSGPDFVAGDVTTLSTDGCIAVIDFGKAGAFPVTLTTGAGQVRTMTVKATGDSLVPETGMILTQYDDSANGMRAGVTDASAEKSCEANTSGTAIVLWGDGSTTIKSITVGDDVGSHTYGHPGTYTVRYSYRDADGNKSMAKQETITVPFGDTNITIDGTITTTVAAHCSVPAFKDEATCEATGFCKYDTANLTDPTSCTDAGYTWLSKTAGDWIDADDYAVDSATVYVKLDATTIVKIVKTDANGYFTVVVPAGSYIVDPDKVGYDIPEQTGINSDSTLTFDAENVMP